jgi:AraC-like DNA-binding protein
MYVTAFWAVVLITSPKKRNLPKHFLGVFMLTAFLVYFSHMLYFKQQFNAYLLIDPVYMFASLAVYPMYFWYIRLLTAETRINYKNLWLLTPAAFFSVLTLVVYLFMNEAEKNEYLRYFLIERIRFSALSQGPKIQAALFIAGRFVFSVQIVLFLYFGRKLVIQYNKRIANFYSNLENKTIIWVKNLLYSFVATSIMSLIFNVIGRSVFVQHSGWLLLPSLIFSVLLFFIGFQGHLQNHTVKELREDESREQTVNLKAWNSEQLKGKLLDLFEKEKVYKDANLKITYVSSRLNTNRTYISKLINQEFQVTFNDFVNRYRVDEAKSMLENDPDQRFSLNYIYETAGFGSLSSFIRIFKEVTGKTPGQFRTSLKKR